MEESGHNVAESRGSLPPLVHGDFNPVMLGTLRAMRIMASQDTSIRLVTPGKLYIKSGSDDLAAIYVYILLVRESGRECTEKENLGICLHRKRIPAEGAHSLQLSRLWVVGQEQSLPLSPWPR